MDETNKSFLGRGWAFPPAFDLDRGVVEMVENDEDIRQSIYIIINTIPGERMMFPKFGCGILDFVFESDDPTQMSMLEDAIYDALLFYEPRIRDIKITIERNDIRENPQKDGHIVIHISYIVIITNTRNNMVFPYYLKEGTNL